jgi:predicted transposase YdaD
MKTDKELYQLFRKCPELLKDFICINSPASYRFRAEELKEFTRRVDGFFISREERWSYVVEFQAYVDPDIYRRAVVEQILLSQQHPNKKVALVIVFFAKRLDPKTEPWNTFCLSDNPYFRKHYLVDILERLAEKDPNHSLVLLFKPLVEKPHNLEKTAREYYRRLSDLPLPSQKRQTLLDIFEYWMLQLFKDLPVEEVKMMYTPLTPLEETRGYKDLIAKGEAIGEIRGEKRGELLGKIEVAAEMFAKGWISEKQYQQTVEPLEKKLEGLKNRRRSPSRKHA